MKKCLILLLACMLLLAAPLGCGAKKDGAVTTPPEPDPALETAGGGEPAEVGLPNPVVTVGSYEELLSAVPGVLLSDAPEGANGISYSYIKGEPVIAQIEFMYEDNEYTYRAAAATIDAQSDISGIYEDLSKTAQLSTEDNITMGGEYLLRYAPGETKGLATWYYAPTSCQYSLYTPTGCDISQAIEEVVDILLPITQDASGNPLGGAISTPLPAIEEGKVTGTIVSIGDNDIVLNIENGTTLQFMLSNIANTGAKVGDTAEITYSGNILDAPEVISFNVTQSAPVKPQISGTVMQYSSSSVFVTTTSQSVYGFVIDGATSFSGQSTQLKKGNAVTVTYTGDLANSPIATLIETTTVTSAPEPAQEAAGDPVNKSLKGYVSSLTSKRVSIYTDSGHAYTFQRGGSTTVTGDYALEVGSRIRVRYDGYASQGPLAKRIEVLSPPDPTPPSPVTRTIEGTVTMQAGNALSVQADSGRNYSFLLAAPTIVGSGGTGDRVRVTFVDDGYGNYTVTRIEYITPIVYGPGPVIDSPDYDIYAVG